MSVSDLAAGMRRALQAIVTTAPSSNAPSGTDATISASAIVAIVVAVIALLGVLTGALLNRASGKDAAAAANRAATAADKAAAAADTAAKQLDIWRKREETMRTLRWAAELALSTDAATKVRGTKILTSLMTVSSLVQPEDLAFITAVLSDVLSPARDILLAGIRREGPEQ